MLIFGISFLSLGEPLVATFKKTRGVNSPEDILKPGMTILKA